MVAIFLCNHPVCDLLDGRALAQGGGCDQPAGDPGDKSDPVFSVSSLQQYLNQSFQPQDNQLGSLQERLTLVSQDLIIVSQDLKNQTGTKH